MPGALERARPTVVVLCVHGEAKEHWPPDHWLYPCPGGRVLEQAIIIERDTDGEWPDDAYERISQRLTRMGGTEYWKKPSHRIAYAKLCMDALADIPLTPVTLTGDALASAQENQP